MVLVSDFPHRHNLINRHEAHLLIFILEMKHGAFHPDHFATEARSTAAIEINFLADESGQYVLHCLLLLVGALAKCNFDERNYVGVVLLCTFEFN